MLSFSLKSNKFWLPKVEILTETNTYTNIQFFFSIFRFTAVRAMWLLSPFHPIRRIAIRVLAHPIFSLIVILTILANCYVMILPDSEYTNATEIVFTAIYTYESAVKVSKFIYHISLNNIRGNYLKVSKLYVLILTILWKLFKGRYYSREDTN